MRSSRSRGARWRRSSRRGNRDSVSLTVKERERKLRVKVGERGGDVVRGLRREREKIEKKREKEGSESRVGWVLGFFFLVFFFNIILIWSGGSSEYPTKNLKSVIRPYICSWTDGRMNGLGERDGFGGFLPTPTCN